MRQAENSGQKPSVIADKHVRAHGESRIFAAPRGHVSLRLFASLYKIHKVDQRPDHQRQIKRLRHRRGLHVDKIGIQGKDKCRQPTRWCALPHSVPAGKSPASRPYKPAWREWTRQCPSATGDHSQQTACRAHGQRQPDRAKLKKSRRSGIKYPAGNVDMGHSIAIKQDCVLPVIKDQCAKRDQRGDAGE